VVVFLQENKTTDFYFAAMAAWGASVATGPLLAAPPDHDQPHDRNAWVHASMGDFTPLAAQVDTDAVVPYYSYLAKQFTFCDHHFGAATNSTPGHMLAIGGQTPTFRNPPYTGTYTVWDVPSIFTVASAARVDWAVFPDESGYPTKYYASMSTPASARRTHSSGDFLTMARGGTLPPLCYVWSPGGYDEHPPLRSDPQYVARGHDLIWQRVSAVVEGGGWADTTFILTWDDWGGYADSVPTPNVETLPDDVHPAGFQAIGGSRIPLLLFGGGVRQGVESAWHSHASIPKTVIDLLGLPAMGVPRVDGAPSLAPRVDPSLARPAPPAFGTAIAQPAPPSPAPVAQVPPPWPVPLGVPMPPLEVLHGKRLPPPTDGTVRGAPPAVRG